MLRTSLTYFLAVARHGSIRSACTELHVAQSAVSRQLQGLEREIGSVLFERGQSGMRLTAEGELLLSFGRGAATDFSQLAAEINQFRRLERGHVELAVIEATVPGVVPRALKVFSARHPTITYGVKVGGTDAVVAAVKNGEADFGIGYHPTLSPEFKVEYRARERLLAVMAPDHPLAGQATLRIPEMARWPMALSPAGNPARRIFDAACAAAGVEISPVFETNSLELLRRFVAEGNAVTVLLRHSLAISVPERSVLAVPFAEPEMEETLEIFTSRRRTLSFASQALLAVLISCMQETRQSTLTAMPGGHHGLQPIAIPDRGRVR